AAARAGVARSAPATAGSGARAAKVMHRAPHARIDPGHAARGRAVGLRARSLARHDPGRRGAQYFAAAHGRDPGDVSFARPAQLARALAVAARQPAVAVAMDAGAARARRDPGGEPRMVAEPAPRR